MKLQKHHYGVLIVTLLLLGILAGYSLFQNGFVPIALVNGEVIFLYEVEENSAVSQKLYAIDPDVVSGNPALTQAFAAGNQEALFKQVLEGSIVNAIIQTSAPKQVREEASTVAERSLRQGNEGKLSSALKQEYGWDLPTFAERIIKPQILQQMLIEQHGEEYPNWMSNVRSEANVRVWFVPFEWNGEELVEKE